MFKIDNIALALALVAVITSGYLWYTADQVFEDTHNLAFLKGYLLHREHTEERLKWIKDKQEEVGSCLPEGTTFPEDLKKKWRTELIDSLEGDYKRRINLRFEEQLKK